MVLFIFVVHSQRHIRDVLPNTTFNFFGVQISSQSLLILLVSVVLMIILQFIVHRTKIGKAMRAVSHDTGCSKINGD